MAKYQYIFEDTLTQQKLGKIPLYGVNMSNFLNTASQANRYGQFTGTFRADLPDYTVQELLLCTIPGRTNVWVERDGVLIWGGILTTRTYQSQALAYELQAQTFDGYAEGLYIQQDQSYTDDPVNIICDLWNYWQTVPDSNIHLQIPSNITPYTSITQTVTGSQFTATSDVFSTCIQAGAEYRIDISYDVNGKRTAKLVLGRWDQPQASNATIGTPVAQDNSSLRYPGEISSYYYSESGTSAGTIGLAIGSASGSTTITSVKQNDQYIGAGWPLYGQKFNWSNITDQATLDAILSEYLNLVAPPYATPTFTQNSADGFGTFALGDYIYIVLNDQFRWPDQPFATHYRVVGWSLSPAGSNGTENFNWTIDQPSSLG